MLFGFSHWLCFGAGEQWLAYKTVPAEEGIGYLRVEIVTNAPQGVTLPKLPGRAWFGRWPSPIDAHGGRWFCVAEPAQGKAPNLLYFDLNGNNRLDDEQPLRARSSDISSAEFGTFRVRLQTADGPVAYDLWCRAYLSEDNVVVRFGSAGVYEGLVDFGGRKLRVRLLDENVNGAFNDAWGIGRDRDGIEILSSNTILTRLGRFVEVDGELYELEVAPDGAYVCVARAGAVPTGTVKVHPEITELVFVGENGMFHRIPTNGSVRLPAGEYAVTYYEVTRKDARGAQWRLEASARTGKFLVNVPADGTVELGAFEPIRLALASIGRGRVNFILDFLGPHDESVTVYRGTERPRPPRLVLTSLNTDYRHTAAFTFG